jgi:hypothetical protein
MDSDGEAGDIFDYIQPQNLIDSSSNDKAKRKTLMSMINSRREALLKGKKVPGFKKSKTENSKNLFGKLKPLKTV